MKSAIIDPDQLHQLLKKHRYHSFECGGCGQYIIVSEQGNFSDTEGAWKLNDWFDGIRCPVCTSGYRRMGIPEESENGK
jgi:hypothetical protein